MWITIYHVNSGVIIKQQKSFAQYENAIAIIAFLSQIGFSGDDVMMKKLKSIKSTQRIEDHDQTRICIIDWKCCWLWRVR